MTTEQDVKRRIEAAEFELAKAKDLLKDLPKGFKNSVTGRILDTLAYYHPHLDEEEATSIYITLRCENKHRFRAADTFKKIARNEGWIIGCCDAVGTNDIQIRLFQIGK